MLVIIIFIAFAILMLIGIFCAITQGNRIDTKIKELKKNLDLHNQLLKRYETEEQDLKDKKSNV